MIRCIFALVGLLLAPLACHAQPPESLPKEVVAAWRDAGFDTGWMRNDGAGRVEYIDDGQQQPGDLPAFRLFAVENPALAKLPAPAVPFGLDIDGTSPYWEIVPAVSATQLKELERFENLHILRIDRTTVASDGLKALAAMPNLRVLKLSGPATVGDYSGLAVLKSVKSLSLRDGQATEAGLKDLASFKNLHSLHLAIESPSRVYSPENAFLWPGRNTETAKRLKDLAGVKALSLRFNGGTDGDLKVLAGLQNVHSLEIGSSEVTDVGMKELAAR